MCVIMSKPQNVAFPEEQLLKNCWDNNPDMGGFMYAFNGKVYIQKGYETWEEFKKALNKTRKKTGDNIPYVCHFRISTQGYDNSCCQPFPLSGNMRNLKRPKVETNIGIAHNGILSITSDGAKDYSDTMLFITEHLVNIIRGYDWHKDTRTVKLIENLIDGSRFAILDKKGECHLLGKGWIEDKGVSYSNNTYSYKRVVYTQSNWWKQRGGGLWDDFGYLDDDELRWAKYWDSKKTKEIEDYTGDEESYLDPWLQFYNRRTMTYDFEELNCPFSMEDDDSYCECCSNYERCPYIKAIKDCLDDKVVGLE